MEFVVGSEVAVGGCDEGAFEAADVDRHLVEVGRALADELDDALAGRVVAVLGVLGRGLGAGLVAEGGQAVGVVPFEVAVGGLGLEVAARVVGVRGRGGADRDALKLVAGWGERDRACVGAGGERGVVLERFEVVDLVVGVGLGVAAGLGDIEAAWLVVPRWARDDVRLAAAGG